MNRYLLLIKDQTEIYKKATNGTYNHEQAAYDYLASICNIKENDDKCLASITLGKKGYLVLFVTQQYIFMIIPPKLNDDQKLYLQRKKEYLKKKGDDLFIVDLIYENDNIIQEEYLHEKLHDEFDILFERKLNDKSNAVKKLKLT